MIIVNLKGGLGNQLFQYALGRSLSLHNNDELRLDTSTLDNAKQIGNVYRPFALTEFNIQTKIASEQDIRHVHYPYGTLSKVTDLLQRKVLRRHHIGWEPSVLRTTGDAYLDGYWQSPKYFEEARGMLLRDLSLRDPSSDFFRWEATVTSTPSVSLHVRRGDYVSNARVRHEMGTCSPSYYHAAISQVDPEHTMRFFVFSDDMSWAHEQFGSLPNVTFVSGGMLSAAEELILMSQCSHNIIANSTFSWWGAWLNDNADKVVIAPRPWSNRHQEAYRHLIPDTWTTLPRQ